MSLARPRSGPSVSVVVPVYNAELYIVETLEGILSQTVSPHEVIVVDDGSTDGTADLLMRFRGEVAVVRRENKGTPDAHNAGFGRATGDYVARCDADDIWAPTKLERQRDALSAHPDVDIAFAGAHVFGRLDQPFLEFAGAAAPPSGVITDRRAFARSLYRANMICASSTVIRLDLYRKLGPFAGLIDDYDYWLRAAQSGALFYYDPTVLVRYRRQGPSVSSNFVPMYEEAYALHKRYEDLAGGQRIARRVLAADRFQSARALFRLGRTAEARQAIRASLRHWPTAEGLGWAAVLAAPEGRRLALVELIRSAKRRGSHRGGSAAAADESKAGA